MGKQTKKAGSEYGGEWTVEKLEIIDKYLGFYVDALKNQDWARKIYIDAFAGSGKIILPDGTALEGSPSIALKYDFEKYYFIEYDADRIKELQEYIAITFPQKLGKVEFIRGDCNVELTKIFETLACNKNVRGVMFLDPYALELKWNILEQAKQKMCLDIWYLFPMMANRLLQKDKKIMDEYREKLNTLFGNNEWEKELYSESPQYNMFDEIVYIKEPIDELVKYIAKRLKDTFQYEPRIKHFKNSKNSSLFLLCFMITNPSKAAIALSRKVTREIFEKIDKSKLLV